MEDAAWPLSKLPVWADTYKTELQDYFDAMSNGAQKLTLDVHPELLVTMGTEWDYLNQGRNCGAAVKDLLTKLDETIDFTQYDNWNAESRAYNVIAGKDGRVDLIIAIYRRTESVAFVPYAGFSDLGFNGYMFVDSMKAYIFGGSDFNDAGASGITVGHYPATDEVTPYELTYMISIHELMHKFLGEGHPTPIYGSLGVMGNSGNGIALNSFERHLLGYIQYHIISPSTDTVIVLKDYLRTNQAYLIPIPEADRWYYSIEFRNHESPYDTAPSKGVYFFRIYDSYGRNQKVVHVISADGNYQWALDSLGKPYKASPDPLGGFNVYQKIPIGGLPYWADGWRGDPNSAFTKKRNEFSIHRNPTPDFINGRDTIRTNLHFRILRMDDTSAVMIVAHTSPAILRIEAPISRDIVLQSNYPNPVTSGSPTTIQFSIPTPQRVLLELYNSLGVNVKELHNDWVEEGLHAVLLPTEDLPSGRYWYQLRSTTKVLRKSFIITR